MASYEDYPQLTKFDKSKFKYLRNAIFEVSRKLGSGVLSPVPYDTAWVARIPEINKCRPAFPESLQWLRHHQTEDGSWGTDYPFSIYSKLLNTFAAVLALSQWNYNDDIERISKGIKALETMTKSLPREETCENAFEMIISSFLIDAREFKLDLEFERFEWCSKIGEEKLKTKERDILSNKRNKYWSLLEAAGSMDLELASYRSEITQYGLIAAQPSTTAFILRYARIRGDDFSEAEWTLKNLSAQNQGGIPHIVPVDNFEIIHGLDFLFKVNINPKINVKYAATQHAIDLFKKRMATTSGIGFSSNWPIIDEECTKTASSVRRQIWSERFTNSAETFSRDEQAIASNFLKSWLSHLKTNSVHLPGSSYQRKDRNTYATSPFGKTAFINRVQNVSFYYTLLQYVFANPKPADESLSEIVSFLGKSQSEDGGWGATVPSSAEETAYVCLSIFRLVQTRKEVLNNINFPKLVKFMNNLDHLPNESFWCYKVLFGSAILSDTIVTAAKYGIFLIQRLCMFTDAINDNRLDFLNVEYRSKHDQLLHRGTFLLTRPEVPIQDIEVSKTEVEDICKSVLETENPDEYMQKLLDVSLEFSYWTHEYKMLPSNRAIDVLFTVFLFVFDDIIDYFLKGKEATTKIDEIMKVPGKILRGHYQNFDSVPTFDLPRIDIVWKWCFHGRQMMEKNNWNIESFAKIMEENLLKGFYQGYKLHSYGIEATSRRYLEISTAAAGFEETVHYATLLQDSTVDSTEFADDELIKKYKYCGFKAARIFSDVPSVFKDKRLSQSDNYCLCLMHDYGISLADAMIKATKKSSKELLKMYSLRRMILMRENESKEKLALVMLNVDRCINACLRWSLETERYQLTRDWLAERACHEKKDLTFTWDLCFS